MSGDKWRRRQQKQHWSWRQWVLTPFEQGHAFPSKGFEDHPIPNSCHHALLIAVRFSVATIVILFGHCHHHHWVNPCAIFVMIDLMYRQRETKRRRELLFKILSLCVVPSNVQVCAACENLSNCIHVHVSSDNVNASSLIPSFHVHLSLFHYFTITSIFFLHRRVVFFLHTSSFPCFFLHV